MENYLLDIISTKNNRELANSYLYIKFEVLKKIHVPDVSTVKDKHSPTSAEVVETDFIQ